MARPRRKRRTIRRRRDLRSKSGMLYDSVSAARAQSFGEQSRREHAKRCALSARERCAAAVMRTPFRRARPARGNAPRQTPSTHAGLHVVLGHLRRHLRHLPELAQRAEHRVPGEPVAEQRERPLDRLRLLRPRLPFGLHPRWLKTRSVCPSATRSGSSRRSSASRAAKLPARGDLARC